MPPDYEVIIVGCGPAGNTLAYHLAREGRRVLLLEKETLPRRKVCGGGLSRKTLLELHHHYSLLPVVECTIDDALLAYGNAEVVHRTVADMGAMVRRDLLDDFMTKKALEAGADLEESCRFERYEDSSSTLRVFTSRGEFRTRILVGADGVYSRVRRQLYPSHKTMMVPAIEALIYPPQDRLTALGRRAIFDLGAMPGGYAWIFPKKDHFNVGLYRYVKTPQNTNLKAALKDWVRRHPLLLECEEMHVGSHSIPVRPIADKLAKDNVILVGDAAGLAEAFYGEGIYHAVRSAYCAAESIRGYLEEGTSLSKYDRILRPLRFNLLSARVTADIFYRLPAAISGKMMRSRIVSRLFAGLITGRLQPTECFLYTIGLAPLWFLEPRVRSRSMTGVLRARG